MRAVAIIPARGGSKGLPRKNLITLCGKPLIAWTIEAATGARHVGRVVVSTDDAEIAAVARHWGAQVIDRPSEISGDDAPSEAAILHALEHLESAEGLCPEVVAFLQCTSPLTRAADIDGTIEALLEANAESALAVTPFHYFLWRRDGSGGAIGVNHDKQLRLLRQQQEPQYLETGAVYVMRAEGFKQAKQRFFGRTAVYVMPAERRLEIDEPSDVDVAQVRLADRLRRERASALPMPVAGLVMDFDGVFTDNRVLINEDGREAVLCNRSDGMGLEGLKRRGIPMLVLSKEANEVVRARCRKLGIECLHGVEDKLGALRTWCEQHRLDLRGIVFAGNDINDVECLRAVGCGVAVGDAHADAKNSARIVLSAHGGQGAIRELTEIIDQRLRGDFRNE
jgi:N-acylneuraminate cytidylyltransferase